MTEVRNDCVICPNCCHQFGAIPVDVQTELANYKATAPLCEKHQPNGGSRANCLVCALVAQSAAFSRIDYLCGEPNEMEVSGYDVHCDENSVVENVRRLRVEYDDLLELLQESRKYISPTVIKYSGYQEYEVPAGSAVVDLCGRIDSKLRGRKKLP